MLRADKSLRERRLIMERQPKRNRARITSFFIRGVPAVKVESDAIRIEGVDVVFYFMGEGKEKNLRAFVGKLIEGVGK